MTTVLVLAGTAEARALAARLAGIDGLRPVASLAGVTAAPADYAISVRQGGFGGIDGLADWLTANAPAVLIDATHPFALQMQHNALEAAARTGTPRLRLLRQPWPDRPGWIRVPDFAAAADALPGGASVLLTTGRKEVAPFAARPDVSFHLRSIEPAGALPPHIQPMIARPPFSRAQETATLAALAITHLVTKNAGGAGQAKLDAAEALRLGVIMIDRPPPPQGPIVEDVASAVNWLREVMQV